MPNNLAFDQASTLLKGFVLPPQPSIITSIRTVAPDLGKMAHVIERDPAISAAVLKVINSPSIGLRTKVASITHAVTLLGFGSIMNIVNAVSLNRALGADQQNTKRLNNFWHSTNDVALAMSIVVRQLNMQQSGVSVDEAYCLGLFHNCGMPAMVTKFPDYFTKIIPAYQLSDEALTDTENREFHTNHAVLGYYITKSWNLPTPLTAVIQIHHNRFVFGNLKSLDESVLNLFVLLKFAEHIVGEAQLFGETQRNFEWELLADQILFHLGLTQLDVDELKDIVIDTIENEEQ